MDEHTLYAARDPRGIRPLVLGRLERGWVVASETAALDIVGAAVIREVEPGSYRRRCGATAFATPASHRPTARGCCFEYVYLARPDTTITESPGAPRPRGRDRPPPGPRSTPWTPTS